MRKASILFVIAIFPFLAVWTAFILTLGSFDPTNVFQNDNFWGVSVMYWIFYLCLIGPLYDLINESEESIS